MDNHTFAGECRCSFSGTATEISDENFVLINNLEDFDVIGLLRSTKVSGEPTFPVYSNALYSAFHLVSIHWHFFPADEHTIIVSAHLRFK